MPYVTIQWVTIQWKVVYEFGKYILDIERNWKEIPNLGFGYLVKRILCTSQATDLGGWNRCTQVLQGLRNQFITKNIEKQCGECWKLMFMNCSFILVYTCLDQPVDIENFVNGDATCGFVGALPGTVWMAWRHRVFPRYPAEGFPQLLQLLPAPATPHTIMGCWLQANGETVLQWVVITQLSQMYCHYKSSLQITSFSLL